MAQDLSIEHPEHVVFITTRTIGSKLWFINNHTLHQKILGYLAKYQSLYKFELFGFILMGNHYHLLARFPLSNRAAFLRSFNSIIARLVSANVPSFRDGRLWARRARVQVVPNPEDVLDRFLYLTLNPVLSGICKQLSAFNGYNSLDDVIHETTRTYKVVNWREFANRSRYNKSLKPSDFEQEYALKYSRLSVFSKHSPVEFQNALLARVERGRQQAIHQRQKLNKGFALGKTLMQTKPGAHPINTKKSHRNSHRPLVLTLCANTRRWFLEYYFATLKAYKAASALFRAGNLTVRFPQFTYRPVVPA